MYISFILFHLNEENKLKNNSKNFANVDSMTNTFSAHSSKNASPASKSETNERSSINLMNICVRVKNE